MFCNYFCRMKFAMSVFLAALLVAAQATPASEQKVRSVRQVAAPFNTANNPLSQLLQDALLVSSKYQTFSKKKKKIKNLFFYLFDNLCFCPYYRFLRPPYRPCPTFWPTLETPSARPWTTPAWDQNRCLRSNLQLKQKPNREQRGQERPN